LFPGKYNNYLLKPLNNGVLLTVLYSRYFGFIYAMDEKKKTSKEVVKIAKRIKELRVKKGYSSYEVFAYENGISRSQFGKYEKGENMRIESLLKVIKALGVTPEEFFKGI
jgi:DNA-binding Xre family transcriptional regulator